MNEGRSTRAPAAADIMAVSFGSTIAVWTAAYLTRLPLLAAPRGVTLALFVGVFVGGGVCARRLGIDNWTRVAATGFLTAVLNLLILGSLLVDPGDNSVVPDTVVWLPAFVLTVAGLMVAGWVLGRKSRPNTDTNWTGILAVAVVAAASLLIVAGGLVTGFKAGMAVEDWPQTKAVNMFLYPLARMTGGIYYEHTHRLLGALVGLGTLALTGHLYWRASADGSYRRPAVLSGVAFVMVVAQGVLGGFRVVDHDIVKAAIHGILGQVVLATIVAVAVVVSRTWQLQQPRKQVVAPTDRNLCVLIVGLLLLQLTFGSLLRHLDRTMITHVSLAAVILLLALVAGMRAWALHPQIPALRRTGIAVTVTATAQLALGIIALLAREKRDCSMVVVGSDAVGSPTDAVLTTLHQADGAALLALFFALLIYAQRLLQVNREVA